jgi:hypothetical protein
MSEMKREEIEEWRPRLSALWLAGKTIKESQEKANALCDLALSALTARSEGFRDGVEAAARVCENFPTVVVPFLRNDIAKHIRALSPRETDAAPQEQLGPVDPETRQCGLATPAASAPSGEVAEMQQAWKIVAAFFESRNWPDTKLGNAASYLQARLPALLSKVGQTQPDENPSPPERP